MIVSRIIFFYSNLLINTDAFKHEIFIFDRYIFTMKSHLELYKYINIYVKSISKMIKLEEEIKLLNNIKQLLC